MEELLSRLPQQPPFRFVDRIIEYVPHRYMISRFDSQPLQKLFGGLSEIPFTILIEALAQTSVLFIDMEVGRLSEGELPLLGKIECQMLAISNWTSFLCHVSPIRVLAKRAMLRGEVFDESGRLIVSVELAVAVTEGDGGVFAN
ncbi:hotdog family protein [Paenibacillus kobensis]|uniref:hypothetical protein n=1 Tax=Paenibacillus kobensis TaxID=59841 RepID=UPI000FD7F184|nr:hypothetical protein [Paenibacillus kobensis]